MEKLKETLKNALTMERVIVLIQSAIAVIAILISIQQESNKKLKFHHKQHKTESKHLEKMKKLEYKNQLKHEKLQAKSDYRKEKLKLQKEYRGLKKEANLK